jgi:hypothetical protein
MNARALCVLGLAALTGCASTVARRPAGPEVGNQGGAWEVVLAGGESQPESGGELQRRDWAMGVPEQQLSVVEWPAPYQPSLDDARFLFLPRGANQVLYYSDWPWRGYRRGPWR